MVLSLGVVAPPVEAWSHRRPETLGCHPAIAQHQAPGGLRCGPRERGSYLHPMEAPHVGEGVRERSVRFVSIAGGKFRSSSAEPGRVHRFLGLARLVSKAPKR